MKFFTSLIPSIILSAVLCSCSGNTPLGDSDPVHLPNEPKNEDYFVGKDSIINHFAAPQPQPRTLKFNFNGSLLIPTRHNRVQGFAIGEALQSPKLADQQYTFIIRGPGTNVNHCEALLNHLSNSKVGLERFQVISQPTSPNTTVLEDTRSKKEREPVTVIMHRL